MRTLLRTSANIRYYLVDKTGIWKAQAKCLGAELIGSLNLDSRRISEQCRLFRTQTGLIWYQLQQSCILLQLLWFAHRDPCGFVLAVIAARQAHLNRASDQDASHKARLKLEGNQQLQEETQGQGINQSGSVKTSFMSIMSPGIAISISQNTLNKFGGKLLCCRTRDQSKLSRSLVLSDEDGALVWDWLVLPAVLDLL